MRFEIVDKVVSIILRSFLITVTYNHFPGLPVIFRNPSEYLAYKTVVVVFQVLPVPAVYLRAFPVAFYGRGITYARRSHVSTYDFPITLRDIPDNPVGIDVVGDVDNIPFRNYGIRCIRNPVVPFIVMPHRLGSLVHFAQYLVCIAVYDRSFGQFEFLYFAVGIDIHLYHEFLAARFGSSPSRRSQPVISHFVL